LTDDYLRSRLGIARQRLSYLIRTRHLIWEACGWWTVGWAALLIVNAIVPVALVWITRVSIDEFVIFIETGGANLSTFLAYILIFALLLVFRPFSESIIEWINIVQAEKLRDHATFRLHEHVNQLGVDFFDYSENHDRLYRAQANSKSSSIQLLQSAGTLAQSAITLAGLFILLVTYSPWLPLILLLVSVPVIAVSIYYASQLYMWRVRNTSKERQASYLDFLITTIYYVAELRIFGLGRHFAQSHAHIRDELRTEYLRLERNRIFSAIGALLFSLIATGLIMAWMGYQVLIGQLSIGQLAAFYQIFNQGQQAIRGLLQNIVQLYRSSLYIADFFQLIDTPIQPDSDGEIATVDLPLRQGIRFENIAFRYPGSDVEVLKQFNWEIPAGKIVALVGENGEGKSTLMKLLCRLYTPDAGRVLWDSIDLQQLNQGDIFRAVTILLQSPLFYAGTAYENIALGDVTASFDQGDIERAARQAGIHDKIMSLSQAYQTIIGKAFGGEELSGGQWQRLALARAIIRQAHIVILDEPTSAMDSWAEIDWLKRLRELVDDQIVIIITHRFTTAMQADLIYVMKDGQITEQGTHEALISAGGHYAQSWKAQMRQEAQGVSPTGLAPEHTQRMR
jgi:ATP-binding cassette, subfamily B, bacterial